jgi:hypothetical protein
LTLHVKRFAVVSVGKDTGWGLEVIAGLNRVPADMPPMLCWLLAGNAVWHRSGKERELYLPAKIVVIDKVGPTFA